MKKFIYGIDNKNPEAAAEKLAALGYDSVILPAGDVKAFEACNSKGLETYICYSAFGMSNDKQAEYGALDCDGDNAPWFSSSCPNAIDIAKANQDAAFAFAEKVPFVKGIIVDGARFASFASGEGIDSFFGCFCERCLEKMLKMNFNAPAIKDGISELKAYLYGRSGNVRRMKAAFDAWMDFRSKCVKEYMSMFSMRAKMTGLRSGAFVFAPSLWQYVGQTIEALKPLDMVLPMIYRDYPHEEGPATLNFEWKAFDELCSHTEKTSEQVMSLIFETAAPEHGENWSFSSEHVLLEAQAAKIMLTGKFVAPIIQTEDEELDKVYDLLKDMDAVGEFMYAQKKF